MPIQDPLGRRPQTPVPIVPDPNNPPNRVGYTNFDDRIEYDGFFFDPQSGMMFESRTAIYPNEYQFTFENVFSSLWGFFRRRLNPFDYATILTSYRVREMLQPIAYSLHPNLTLITIELSPTSFFGTAPDKPQRHLRAVRTDDLTRSEMFSAGRLASSIMRNGYSVAVQSFEAELRQAGLA